ncbi:plasmid recombination protein [Methyloradius palustris]|uniref:Plasmid recombination enzyme n=1 Tax=Methyloradius palustris TaxID=2778876 RepID=A0A8D5FZ09_9PROT|nr:plasmid recombination protein [Methyloradius palustris]BCM24350.1 hypothetical protein ZMTM_06090 [Methyloradius palustris]
MAKKEQKSQFMHLELYSRTGAIIQSSKARKTSTVGVINEAIRTNGFTSHIMADGYSPAPPTYLYSQNNLSLDDHYKEILAQVENEKDSLGRKIKSDKNILLAGVVSYPKPRLANNWDSDDKQNYIMFKDQSIEFMKNKWGDNLLCVLEHTDEEYPHLHFYVVNKNRIASTPEMHPGFAENIRLEKEAKAENRPVIKKEQVSAYKIAMRKFQDDFFNTVSIYCGFDRLGPKVQRLTRTEWKIRKQVTRQLAKAIRKTRKKNEDLNIQTDELNQLMLELEQETANVLEMQIQVEMEQKQVAGGLKDIAMAQYFREHHKDLVVQYNIEQQRKKYESSSNLKLKN